MTPSLYTQRHGADIRRAPLAPATFVLIFILSIPNWMLVIAFPPSVFGPLTAAMVAVSTVSGGMLVWFDRELARWSTLHELGERARPGCEAARRVWRSRRPRLAAAHRRATRWLAWFLGVLAMIELGLVEPSLEPVLGLSPTPAGALVLATLVVCATALVALTWPLRWLAADYDLPELAPPGALRPLADAVPVWALWLWRCAHFGIPVVLLMRWALAA